MLLHRAPVPGPWTMTPLFPPLDPSSCHNQPQYPSLHVQTPFIHSQTATIWPSFGPRGIYSVVHSVFRKENEPRDKAHTDPRSRLRATGNFNSRTMVYMIKGRATRGHGLSASGTSHPMGRVRSEEKQPKSTRSGGPEKAAIFLKSKRNTAFPWKCS